MAAVALVAVAFDPWGFRPFTTLRWPLVGIAVVIACYGRTWRAPRRMGVAWLVLLLALGLAAALSQDPISGILGHPRRHLGLIGWGICALAFVAGAGLHRTEVQTRLARGTALAGLLTGLAAIVDRLGWDPGGVEFAGNRVGGLLGQPVYLAAFVVLVLPICVAVSADSFESRRWRWTGGVAAAACVIALWASETRGAWLGALVAGAVGVAVHEDLRGWVARRWRAAVVVAAVAAVAIIGPLGALFDGSPGGLGRIDDWRVAVRVIADHPLLGVGPEGYRIAAPEHIDAGYTEEHGREEIVDRAHNNVLDVAASGGLLAAGAYVVLLASLAACCVRLLRQRASPVLAGAAIGVLAWLAQQTVSFPLAEVDPAGWMWAGAVVAAVSLTPTGRSGAKWSQRTCIGLAAIFAFAGVTALAADRQLHRAQDRMHGFRAVALREADGATRLRPDDIDAWYVAAQVAASGKDLLSVDAGLDRVEQGLDWFPHDPALLTLHEELLVERALRSGLTEDLERARTAAEEMVRLDPTHPEHRRRLELVVEALEGETQGER